VPDKYCAFSVLYHFLSKLFYHSQSTIALQELLSRLQNKTMLLSSKLLAMLALVSISLVAAAPIAGNSAVENRDAQSNYGDYGNYGAYGTYCKHYFGPRELKIC
jgi:TorA maturation chaperone TorD